MSYLDEADDDHRTADGRSGEERRRRGPAARPAWDAATYGRPDDVRPPPRRPARPDPDPVYPDSYREPDPSFRAPDPPPHRDLSPPAAPGAPAYPLASPTYPAASPAAPEYPPVAYQEPEPAYRDSETYRDSEGRAERPAWEPDRSPEVYRAAEPDPATYPYAGGTDPFATGNYPTTTPSASTRYPMAPTHRPDSYAPDAFTSFQASTPSQPGAEAAGPDEPEPTYVASGLFLDDDQPDPAESSDETFNDHGSSRYRAASGDEDHTDGSGSTAYPGGWDAAVPEPAAPSAGRAGRNLPAAIGVGVGLGALVLASLFLWRPAFLAVVAGAVGVGIWELVRAIRTRGVNPPLIPLIAGGALMTGLAWWGHAVALTFGLVVTVLAVMAWRLADGVTNYERDVTAATLVAVYVPFLAGFAALLASPPDGDLRIIAALAAVVLSDTGGYIAGVFFGRHPMAPSVSPKKSWEGLGGSLVATAIGSAILLFLFFDAAIWWGVLFGLAVSVASVVGDLGESMIKRDLGVKDMGTLLPGHGGLMDRLDSILFAAPTAFVLLSVIAPTA